MSKKLINPIEEYFIDNENNKNLLHSKELFTASDDNVDIKTDLDIREIVFINKLMINDIFLKSKGLKPVFNNFYSQYMRLKISLDRKSRQEYVKINSNDKTEDLLNSFSNLSNITGTKK